MTLDQNLAIFRKWLWLILLTAIAAGGVTFAIRRSEPPYYVASATVAFGNVFDSQDTASFSLGVSLANSYAALVPTSIILDPTIQALHLSTTIEALAKSIEVKILPETTQLQVTVSYGDPILAASIANEIVDELLKYAQTTPAALTQTQQTKRINDEIEFLQAQIAKEQTRLDNLDKSLTNAITASEIGDLNAQRDVVTSKLSSDHATLATNFSTLANLQRNSQQIQVLQRAVVPTTAQTISAVQGALVAAAVAASITIGIILLITYFDNFNVHAPADIGKTLDLPVLATVERYGSRKDSYTDKLVTHQPLRLEVMESYRLLHTRLAAIRQKNVDKATAGYTFIISSPAPGDGKSLISANLAVTAALFGLRVLLIDGDLRHPSAHRFFNLPNEKGMANLLASPIFLPALVGQADPSDHETLTNLSHALDNYLQYTDFANLIVLPSGAVNEGSARDLGILFRPEWLATLKACTGADIIILDTPPCLAVADSSILAAKTNASVVLVLSAGKTPIAHAIKAKAQFTNVGAEVEGIILNMANPQENEFDYKYPSPRRRKDD